MIKILFFQNVEVFFGFIYLIAIYKHQSDTNVWMQNLALSALAGKYFGAVLGGY